MTDNVTLLRRQLLQAKLRESGLLAATGSEQTRRQAGPRPMSDGQRRLWFRQQYARRDTTLNVCVGYRLSGPLDGERLHRALDAVVARHDILRTTYRLGADGEPEQTVRDHGRADWSYHDLGDEPVAERDAGAELFARREFARPFDLATDSVLRASVIRTDDNEHVLLLVLHHICWDDECWGVFVEELAVAYRTDAALPLENTHYADVVPPGEAVEDDRRYWSELLTPLPDPPDLPGGHGGRVTSSRARQTSIVLPGELVEQVRCYARERSATPFAVLLAAFQALIRRYTRSEDFLVAVPVVDRPGPSMAGVIGYFGNTVLLRCAPQRDSTFAELVQSSRDGCAEAFAHQRLGVDRVVAAVNPRRSTDGDGLAEIVRVGFAARTAAHPLRLPDVVATRLELRSAAAQLPLGLTVEFGADGVVVEAEYLVDVLDDDIVCAFLGHYRRLLERALLEPERAIGGIDLFDVAEHAVLRAASRGKVEQPRPDTLVAMVQRRVAADRDRIAVCDDAGEHTYGALNAEANRLAHWMIGRGVGPEDLVALIVEASADFVVAALAVLKSGGGYLPIDPAYPADRISGLLADAAPALTLDRELLTRARAEAAALSSDDPTDADRRAPLRPENVAYVIYTSGSSGRPKGVPVAHAAIADHLVSMHREFDMTAADRVLQTSSPSFDASVFEIFTTLTLGARLVVAAPSAVRDLDRIGELVERHGITVLHMVPSLLGALLTMPSAYRWKALRRIPIGGEALPGDVADKAAVVFDAALSNHYGPTEAVVAATQYRITRAQTSGIVPIGVPNRNVEVRLLDEALQPVPAGVVGEIYLGGPQLARGYLGRAAATAERFVAAGGGRMYRTGDLARRTARGDLEFVGRADEQVKIRGFRVELGEIEAALASHPDVARAVVIACELPGVGTVAAGYLVPAAGVGALDLARVRAQAATVLPAHMVPASLIAIDAIPVTPHGKFNRRALPAPVLETGERFRAPATPTEVRLGELYAGLLGRARVGADDSFFALGGHSLLAGRLITRIRAEFDVDIDIRAPFDAPTVAGLAALIDAAQPAQADARLTGGPRPEVLPLSYAQRAVWWNLRLGGAGARMNIPLAARLDGPLNVPALVAACRDVITRHEALRTVFVEQGGVPRQMVRAAGEWEPTVRTVADNGDLPHLLATEAGHRFDIGSELPVRMAIITLAAGSHVLSVVVHHISADHWSLRTLLADLAAAYRARSAGGAPDWQPPAVQYADYALWEQQTYGAGDGRMSARGRAELDYWRATLAGLPVEVGVPADRPRPAVLGARGEVAHVTVPAPTRRRLAALAAEHAATEFMVCQAAVATVLHTLDAGEDIVFGTPMAGTEDGTAAVVGLFANMVALRHDLSAEPTLRTILDRVRAAALGAYRHRALPIERLVEALNPPRSLSRNPLFQVMLHYREQDWAAADFAEDRGIATTMLALPFDTAYLDLSLNVFVDEAGGFDVGVIANADLYDRATAELIADRLARVLTAFAEQPESTPRQLVLPGRHERPSRDAAQAEPAAPHGGFGRARHAQPVTATEKLLAGLLEELLEINGIGRDDGFFALGGDSVMSLQWASRAAESGLALTPQLVFEHHTIAELAAAVDSAPGGRGAPDRSHEPMSVSGLNPAELSALTGAWQERA